MAIYIFAKGYWEYDLRDTTTAQRIPEFWESTHLILSLILFHCSRSPSDRKWPDTIEYPIKLPWFAKNWVTIVSNYSFEISENPFACLSQNSTTRRLDVHLETKSISEIFS